MPKKSAAILPRNRKNHKSDGSLDLEMVAISDLKSHPRNYLGHPDDEVEHICESIRENGVYKNIVVARDGTILAGHGVVKALAKMGYKQVSVKRLPLAPDDPRAIKVLVADNEISHLRVVDDRALSELLKEIKDFDAAGLLGTGYDEMMLASLVMVTRPMSEISDFNAAAEWVGMPGYEPDKAALKVIVSFRNKKDRDEFSKLTDLSLLDGTRGVWWPSKDKDDPSSLRFKGQG